jgi:hypothetical protein
MKYKYFNNCANLEEAKKLYKELARKHHPDLGGDLRTMQEINAEYSLFQAKGATAEARARQTNAHAEGKKSAADFHDLDEVEGILKEKIEFALNLDGVEVELIGLWIWISGDTKKHKEAIKANGGWKWSPKKEGQPWYFAGVPSFNRKPQDLETIRANYGSRKFTREWQKEEARAARMELKP